MTEEARATRNLADAERRNSASVLATAIAIQTIGLGTAGTSAVTSVAASGSSVQLLAANTQRITASFDNDSTVNAYLKLGATASTTSRTVKMRPAAHYELPCRYTDVVDCIWDSATGNMRITELSI